MLKKARMYWKKVAKVGFLVVTFLGPWMSIIENTSGKSIS